MTAEEWDDIGEIAEAKLLELKKQSWIKNVIKIQKLTEEEAEALWDKINGGSK